MRRSLWIGLAASALAICGTAVAGDEWDEAYAPPKLTRNPKAEAQAAPERHRHAAASAEDGVPVELSSETVGGYFGLGDEFSPGESYNGLGRLTGSRGGGNPSAGQGERSPAHDHEWNDQPDGYASGHNHDALGGYTGENVYGPMWGVPDDAVGLDGFSGNPYPGLMDGGNEGGGVPADRHDQSAHQPSPKQGAAEARSSEDIQRNHRINRPGGDDD